MFVLTIPLNMEGIKQENNKAIQKDIVELDEHTPVTADMYGYTLLLVEDNESMLTFILRTLAGKLHRRDSDERDRSTGNIEKRPYRLDHQ